MRAVMIVVTAVLLAGCTALTAVGPARTNFGLRDGDTRAQLLGPGDAVQAGDGGPGGGDGSAGAAQ